MVDAIPRIQGRIGIITLHNGFINSANVVILLPDNG